MSCEFEKLPPDLRKLQGLRTHDLVAKMAGVNVRDTARVLLAADMVAWLLEVPIEELAQMPFSLDRPSALNAEKCENAYAFLVKLLTARKDDGLDLLRRIK